MTSKELLIKLMEFKADAIRQKDKYLGDQYFTEEDRADIENWPEEECATVVEKMAEYLTVAEQCPFCARLDYPACNKSDCGDCGFGKRHGICNTQKGPYRGLDLWSIILDYNAAPDANETRAYFEKLYAQLNPPYKDVIVGLMEYISQKISCKNPVLGKAFFSDEDREEIQNWPDDLCEQIVNHASIQLRVYGELQVIHSVTAYPEHQLCWFNPFCGKQLFTAPKGTKNLCPGCTYAERHGVCGAGPRSGGVDLFYTIRAAGLLPTGKEVTGRFKELCHEAGIMP